MRTPFFLLSLLVLLVGSSASAVQESSKYTLQPYLNSQDVLEVRIDATGIPKTFAKLSPTIAYGRDLSGDGKIDTWFFLTSQGVEVIRQEGADRYGRDILDGLIAAKYKTSRVLFLSSVSTTALSYLFFTVDEFEAQNKNFYLDWINLEELAARLDDEIKNPLSTLSEEQVRAQRELISFGFGQLADKMRKLEGRGIYGYKISIALDLAMGAALKWGGVLLSVPFKLLSETALARYLNENIFEFFKSQQKALASKMTAKTSYVAAVKTLGHAWRANVSLLVRAYVIKKKILATVTGLFRGIKKERWYIGANVGFQVVGETFSHWNEIKDPSLITGAKNFITREDILQNLAFMSTDTVLMAGLSSHLKTITAKILGCGLVALTNSSIINFAIKQEDNFDRVALDMGWEVIIGNGQIQADLMALAYFEKLGRANNRPQLKWLGWAFAAVDQSAGYYLYSKAPEFVKNLIHGESPPAKPAPVPTLVLVPIFAD